jgi:5'-nucleotidase
LLILLSNDDGINSEGLHILKDGLSPAHDVWVVAPEKENSCISHAVTLHAPLRIKELHKQTFSTDGTPADSVLLALKVLLPRAPDLIIAGINKGPNMGLDVNYSGTVAAAKEGAFLGISSMAVSLNGRKDFHFHTARDVVCRVIEKIERFPLPRNILLNINVPNQPASPRGFVMTRLGKRIYNGTIAERIDPRGGRYYWIGGDGDLFERVKGTDFYAVSEGYVSVTPLHWDTTHRVTIKKFKNIF